MRECLVDICRKFETIKHFFDEQTKEKENLVDELFDDFMECFSNIKEEKLEYPREFSEDVKLYNEGNLNVHRKFQDIQMRYLMLSDFYDYVRLTKKYKKI